MGIVPEQLRMIEANAALAIQELSALSQRSFGFDEESVAWVEGFIERQREEVGPEASGGLVNVLGSYLGQAIVVATGAAWDTDDGGNLGIAFANGDMAYPFTKVGKQIEQGVEGGESILSFYNVCVDHIATGQLGRAVESEEAP
jgi:hypothetical protein